MFSPGSDRLIIATVDSRILICSLTKWESGEFEVLCEFKEHCGGKGTNAKRQIGTITSMTVSADGQWLVTADHLNRIHVFNMDSLKVGIATYIIHIMTYWLALLIFLHLAVSLTPNYLYQRRHAQPYHLTLTDLIICLLLWPLMSFTFMTLNKSDLPSGPESIQKTCQRTFWSCETE